MTASYSIQFTVSHNFQDECQPNAWSLSSKPAISPKYNCIHLRHVFWYIITAFIVLVFVKVQTLMCFYICKVGLYLFGFEQ